MKLKLAVLATLGFAAQAFGQSVISFALTDTSSSGNAHYDLQFIPTLNQTGSAGYTDIFINRTETATGSGHQYFEDYQVAGTDKWVLDHSGTVTLGTWNGSPITNAFTAAMAANTLKGNNTGSSATPADLTVSQVKTLLSLSNVENTALSTWAGSSNLTTVGTLSSGAIPTSLLTGTINLASTGSGGITGTLALGHGGTGQTTANLARNAIDQGTVALTDGSSIATDCSTGNVFTVTLGGNRTLANPTNLAAGASYTWLVTQDSTGSRTLAYGTAFKWPGGTAPTLTSTAGAVDILTAITDGTVVYARATLNYAPAVVHGSQSYTTAGSYTFTVPAGVTLLTDVILVGGGGSSGGPGGSGGGGGGGDVEHLTNVSVTPGQTIAITVGAGGAAGAINQPGNAGASTTALSTTALGGGRGPGYLGNGGTGGSGGGGGGGNSIAVSGSQPPGTGGGASGSNAHGGGNGGDLNDGGSDSLGGGGGGGGASAGGSSVATGSPNGGAGGQGVTLKSMVLGSGGGGGGGDGGSGGGGGTNAGNGGNRGSAGTAGTNGFGGGGGGSGNNFGAAGGDGGAYIYW